MAEFLHFSRDSRMYLVMDGRAWTVPVLDGFSFSQATNASEITLNEMEDSSGRSRRGRKMFTDSLSAAEWSFSTYTRPFISAGNGSAKGTADSTARHHAVEELLWVAMGSKNEYSTTEFQWGHGTASGNGTIGGALTYFKDVNGNKVKTLTSSLITALAGASPAQIVGNGAVANRVGSASSGATIQVAVPGSKPQRAGYGGAASKYTATVLDSSGNAKTEAASATLAVTVSAAGAVTNIDIVDRGIGFEDDDVILIGGKMIALEDTAATDSATDLRIGKASGSDQGLVLSEAYDTSTSNLDINFFDSNRSALSKFDIYFVLSDRSAGRLIYKLSDAVVNEASVDFEIDGIATINWSGFAGQITDFTSQVTAQDFGSGSSYNNVPTASAAGEIAIDTGDSDSFYISTGSGNAIGNYKHTIDEGASSTTNFIRNRLTQLTLAPDPTFQATNFLKGTTTPRYETSYQVALTGGNITISNNLTFLTPEELGRVNQPIEHVTGTRTVTGSATCYLGSSDAATNKSKNLFEDLVSDVETVINEFELKFDIGGTTGTPRLSFQLDRCHLEIPSHSIEDVISLETNFHGLGSNIGEADEITLQYVGKAL